MKYSLVILLCCVAGVASAQHLFTVKGVVTDSATGKSLPLVTASLYRNNQLFTAVLTDSMGRFELLRPDSGLFHIRLSMVGYKTVLTTPWTPNGSDSVWNMGVISMVSLATNLAAVTVVAQKPLIEQRADGINFNVASLPSIAGASGTDILRRVPMVAVDANGGLSIRGSSSVRVYIDGKPSEVYAPTTADALKTLKGEDIIKVEVITHPSARYDAEGTDAVVNIITRKAKINGTNGSVSVVPGNRSQHIMGDVHHKQDKWLFNTDVFYQQYCNRNGNELWRETTAQKLYQANESRQTGTYFYGGASVLYSIDSLNTLSVGYRARQQPNTTTNVAENYLADDDLLIPTFQRTTRTPNKNSGNTFSAGYTGASKNGLQEFSLLGMYSFYKSRTGYDLEQVRNELVEYREQYNNRADNRDFIIQADYSRSFTSGLKYETGGKITGRSADNDNRFAVYDAANAHYAPDPFRSNHFRYQNRIYAAYANISARLTKWAFTGGVRYERTELDAVSRDTSLQIPSFSNTVPQVLVSRIVNDRATLKLGYTMRIARPFVQYLDPTVNNSDSLNRQFGNPFLQPEVTNRYQLSYTVNSPKLFKDVAVFFNDNRNTIENIRTPLPGGIFESTWKNVGRNQRLGLAASFSWKPSPALTAGITFTGQYVWLKSIALGITNSGFMREVVITGSYKLPKGYSIDVYGFFSGNTVRLQGYREGWAYYNMTFNKRSKNERFTISIRLDAIFTRYAYIDEATTTDDYYQLQRQRYQNQHMRLIFSYKFNKKEIKNPRMRQVDGVD